MSSSLLARPYLKGQWQLVEDGAQSVGRVADRSTWRIARDFEETYFKCNQLEKAVDEFRTYIRNNAHLIPNDGERYRNGEPITTSFVASTVNQVVSKRFCKRQQMQRSKRGVHLLLLREGRRG